ncbi:tol-pal system-associated acyl-CoA thioesterase [Sphingorhabdus soli]|uniref:Tol-pal system-associated acyl-CoA thioesterase n=1 Tax=Flavisphingopyxis soli TaxID=2601267 RepID=A0A5C6URT3_9SPHN|nr:tol-pal system-associated acyl-CoA thioesterase [Sphingorhabdus soli]TXC73558.1 tol-pal system-associated acyl-CoA thioesterase [Sphingorhabdus soli]
MADHAPLAPISGRFVGAEHHFAVRIYYEDTDLSGIVYHANYLRYMERARSDMLRLVGIDQRAGVEQGLGAYAVTDLHIRYRAPARLDDELIITSTVETVRGASCVIHQTIRRGDTVLTDAVVTAALLDPAGRPRRQPKPWIAAFEAIRTGNAAHS